MGDHQDNAEQLVIAVALFHGFTALDAVGPYELLHRLPNVVMRFVSGGGAGELVPDHTGVLHLRSTASFLDLPHPHILVVPGGYGTREAVKDQAFIDWIKEAHKTSLYTTSVCTGSILLGAAGILQGLEATTHWASYNHLASFGAIPTDKRVVTQGKIITSAGVSSGIDMALELIALLKDEETAKIIQLWVEYDPQPPFDAGAPSKVGEPFVKKAQQYIAKVMAKA